MASWHLHDARARFSEFLDAELSERPQVVTRRGVETAVLIPIGDWRRLQRAAWTGWKQLLLEADRRREEREGERGSLRRRELVEFE